MGGFVYDFLSMSEDVISATSERRKKMLRLASQYYFYSRGIIGVIVHGHVINIVTEMPNIDEDLFSAITREDVTEVARLIDAGADIDQAHTEYPYVTPLTTAARNNHTDIIRLLLDKGADVNKADVYWATPLYLAVRPGHLETLKLLLSNGADVNIQTASGGTALHWAVEFGENLETVKLLLSNGADINMQNLDSWTALHYAVKYSYRADLETVKLLLSIGADINMQTHTGQTAAMIAKAEHLTEIGLYLRGAEDALKFPQHIKSTRKESKEPNQREAASHSVALTAEGESSTQSQHTHPNTMNPDQNITNPSTLQEENKVDLQRHIIEQLEMSSSRKTHKLTRAEKSIEKKNITIEELKSIHQRKIQEKETEIIKLKDSLVTLADSLGEARRNAQNSQVEGFTNLSHITSQIGKVSQQIYTMSDQHLVLSNQMHQTGRALSQQMQQHHAESSMQQVQVKEELSEKIHLDAGRAAPIDIKCRTPKLRKHQKHIEQYMEPDSELLEQFFVEGIIDPDDRRVIERESEVLGKRKRILLLLDRDDVCMSSDVKYRKVVRSLKECSDTGSNYALGQIMEKDV